MKTAARTALAAAVIVGAACSRDRLVPTDPNSTSSLSVLPSVDSVQAGDTVRFSTQDSQPASWTVSDSRVAQIENQAGRSALVRALHPGTTTVTAAEGLRTASGVLIVEQLGAASKLAFTTLPSTAGADGMLTPAVAVTIEDSSGHAIRSATNAVTVALGTNPTGATLSGTTTVNAVNGIAVFTDLRLDRPGTAYTLVATSGTLAAATSAVFVVASGTRAFIWTAAGGMKDLGVLPGNRDSYASAINANGQVVGTMDCAPPQLNSLPCSGARAFIWDAAHGMRNIGTLPGSSMSSARGINSSGQVVGYAAVPGNCGNCTIAVLWSPSGTIQRLGALPSDSIAAAGITGAYGSQALAINDAGQVVGVSWHTFMAQDPWGNWNEYLLERAFIWTQGTGMLFLVDSTLGSVAYAIGRQGPVAGEVHGPGFFLGAGFRWTAVLGMHALGIVDDSSRSLALAVNDGGDVVGHQYYARDYQCSDYCGYSTFADSSFLWSAAGGATNLGTVWARGINTGGQVVGRSQEDPSAPGLRAFVWSSAAGFRDLGLLPYATRSAASAINDVGQVVGWSGP